MKYQNDLDQVRVILNPAIELVSLFCPISEHRRVNFVEHAAAEQCVVDDDQTVGCQQSIQQVLSHFFSGTERRVIHNLFSIFCRNFKNCRIWLEI